MAAPNEYYVRPTNGSDAADGLSHANAWKTLDHAVHTAVGGITADTTDGDRINLNDEADVVLTAPLDIDGGGRYGNPTLTAPLIIQGYTSIAGDGGIGGLSGGGSVSVIDDTVVDSVHLVDLHLHNCGSATIVVLDNSCRVINCEFDNTTGGGLKADFTTYVLDCHFHNIGAIGIQVQDGMIFNCFLKNGTNNFTLAINHSSSAFLAIISNTLSIDGASDGIIFGGQSDIRNNSIYSNGGTGEGISAQFSAVHAMAILNNAIEGFSGAGGDGILIVSDVSVAIYGHNKFYNNTANETLTGDILLNLGNNDVLGSSPFTDPSSDDFTVSTLLKALGYPSSFKGASTGQFLDVGAAQRQEPAAGGLLVHPGMTGGISG